MLFLAARYEFLKPVSAADAVQLLIKINHPIFFPFRGFVCFTAALLLLHHPFRLFRLYARPSSLGADGPLLLLHNSSFEFWSGG